MSGLSFADVSDDSILVYLEDHNAFQEWITTETGGGSEEISIDVARQQITFIPKFHKRPEVVARIHVIGTVAADPRSALWAWANPSFADTPLAEMSTRVREFGERQGISELTTGEVPIEPDSPTGPGDRLNAFAITMAAVACRITGIPSAHVASAADTRVVMLVDAAGFTPARPSGVTFPGIVMNAISAGGWVHDHRRAVQGYAQARNLPHGWEPSFAAINIGFPEGNVRVAFDPAGWVGDIKAQLGPQR